MKDAGGHFLGVVLLSVLCAPVAQSQWASAQNADLVLCQKDFVSSVSGTGPDSLSAPTDVA